MSPLLTRRRIIAAKAEGTPGTAETLTASEAEFNAFDVKINPNIEMVERPGQSALSPLPSVIAGKGGQVTFKTDLTANGNLDVFLLACAMAADGTVYTPASESTATITIGIYEDGLFKRLRGCMGTFVITLESGKPGSVEFTFTGIWDAPTDVELIAPDYPTYIPPRFAGSTLTIGSWTPKVATLTIDRGNEVILREDETDSSGYIAAHVTAWKIVGSLDPEAALVATNDPHGDWIASTEAALVVVVGASGTDIIEIDAPKLQFANVQEGDRNGIQTDELEFQLNRSADAGDDELSITL